MKQFRCTDASHLVARVVAAAAQGWTLQQTGLQSLRALLGVHAGSSKSGGAGDAGSGPWCAAGAAALAATAVACATTTVSADAPQADGTSEAAKTSWFSRFSNSSSSSSRSSGKSATAPPDKPDPSPASGEAAWQQQQQHWGSSSGSSSSSGGEPLSGAIPLLDEDGLTNHPLDYDPITNEHTAAMTLAKQAGVEAYQAGRYGEAERRFREAIAEARLGFPPGDPHIPSALHYLAEYYRNTGRYAQAEELYNEVLSSLLDTLGEKHWMYGAALCSLAALREAQGEYGQAIALLEAALELRRQVFSAGSFLYADTASHLAAVLLKQHAAASSSSRSSSRSKPTGPTAAAAGGSGSGSRGGGGWFGRGRRAAAAAAVHDPPVDVLRAIELLQAAIKVVEEAGHIEDTPCAAWLVELAAAQQVLGHQSAAVDSLKKALAYMALPDTDTNSSSSSSSSSPSGSSNAASAAAGSGAASDIGSGGEDAPGDVAAMRLKLMAQASDVCERLVDAQLGAGDLPGARTTLRGAVEARMALHGRHLVVAKSMTRLANLLMAEPPDPAAPHLAPHFAGSAVAIAEAALQGAQRASLWGGLLRGALTSITGSGGGGGGSGGGKGQQEAERSSERLLAALQLGNACLALAAAEKMNGRPAESEAALRKAVGALRWVLGVGAQDLARLRGMNTAVGEPVPPVLLERVCGLLVDLKLLQMDCLEELAAAIASGGPAAAAAVKPGSSGSAGTSSSSGCGDDESCSGDADEARMLLGEAELLAAELYGD